MATLIHDPDGLGEMTGHTSVNFFQVAANAIHFTNGAGAKVYPAVRKLSIRKNSALL